MSEMAGMSFAEAFRTAVTESGMTLVELVDALADRGVKLTQATLSYWQSGRSLPRRQSSIKALADIEEVLGINQGALSGPLEHERDTPAEDEAGPNARRASGAPVILWGAPRNLDPEMIDWENEVQRKFVHHTITVSDAGHKAVTRAECIVRVTGIANSTMHVGESWGPGDPMPEIVAVDGGTLGTPLIDEAGRFELMPIHLPEAQHSGELRQLGYTLEESSSDRITRTNQRWFAWPLDMFALTVDFGDELPQFVEWVTVQTRSKFGTSERVETSRELAVIDGVCQATLEHVEDGVSFIRWRW